MQHINIEAVEMKASEFATFAARPELDAATAADYAARAQNLREFARSLRLHRRIP